MSLYERIDRYATPRSKDNLEYHVLYAACFCALLLPVALRRFKPRFGQKTNRLSIFSETSAMAANYAKSSFMGI